eukprot:8368322-Ditylum_brightwellii.AAC.1
MEWDNMLQSVVENMIKCGKGEKDMFSVVGSMMNSITKSKPFTRDEASYFLGVGFYKRTSLPNSEGGKSAVLWSKIVSQYKDMSTCDEELNVYKFIVLQMFKKEKFSPQFIGFKQIAKWPLEEHYSK